MHICHVHLFKQTTILWLYKLIFCTPTATVSLSKVFQLQDRNTIKNRILNTIHNYYYAPAMPAWVYVAL